MQPWKQDADTPKVCLSLQTYPSNFFRRAFAVIIRKQVVGTLRNALKIDVMGLK